MLGVYKVVLHGSGIDIQVEGCDSADDRAVGFYTTRTVFALSAEEAINKARAEEETAWKLPPLSVNNRSGNVKISVDKIYSGTLFDFFNKKKGYSFYADEE
ncbi:hypothetical protein [Nitrospirillum sp. BR 11163]|uniref:hypothetical protein n=1 Tax=Nitrospirillum sp. BR 11163 TaxID=3104323 RepID=UPI002AFF1D2C|nr:hypothetical protein [Nitrospirillum sp. BR 11163]MEA1674705.1 hypothetical protein [Nitrospirillum sp. BR 11163]